LTKGREIDFANLIHGLEYNLCFTFGTTGSYAKFKKPNR
jgi:hypothetical protein